MLTHRREQIGELQCHVVHAGGDDPAWKPSRGLVLCHGFGAPGTDLVPLADAICHQSRTLTADTLFVFPEAPLSPPEFRPFGGRAWWPLDMLRLQAAIERGEFRDLRQDAPERLPAAREELTSVLTEIERRHELPLGRIVLGGFSQGSMLATETTLRLPESPAGLVIYSGTLLNESEWTRLAPGRRGLDVLQTHGTEDPILPFEAAGWLRELLAAAGLSVEFQSFTGGHTITASGISSTARLLAEIG